ncbi:hypothetical protein VNI00_012190 [Paramarasmius palmivorus]|uniref:Uncharacterized protein n=1 Tax=Paramarasmius palmivorus TaxID=297713 RepID=A0AAW0C6N1_9AGAR
MEMGNFSAAPGLRFSFFQEIGILSEQGLRPHKSDDSQLTLLQCMSPISPTDAIQDERPSAYLTYPLASPMVPPPPSAESTRSYFELDQDSPRSKWYKHIRDGYFPVRAKFWTGSHSGQIWNINLPQSPMEGSTDHTLSNTTPSSSGHNRTLITAPIVSNPVQDNAISTTMTPSLHPSRPGPTTPPSVVSKVIHDDSGLPASTRYNQSKTPVSIVSTAVQVQGDTSLADSLQDDSSKPIADPGASVATIPDASGSQREEVNAILQTPYIFTRVVHLSDKQVLSYAYFVSERIKVGCKLFIEGHIEGQVVRVLSQSGAYVTLGIQVGKCTYAVLFRRTNVKGVGLHERGSRVKVL